MPPMDVKPLGTVVRVGDRSNLGEIIYLRAR
jgi:hypothetical protein